MNSRDAAALINLIGFTTGGLLYAMLLVMLWRAPRVLREESALHPGRRFVGEKLLIATSILGLMWNLGALIAFALRDLAASEPPPLFLSLAFSALGFLPAVVVHSILSSKQIDANYKRAFWIILIAYLLSAVAAFLHIYTAAVAGGTPSRPALLLLTVSFSVLIAPLIFLTRRQPGLSRTWWIIALSVFAVSALHLSHHEGEQYSWYVELVGHHASLPLIIAILYQHYRFALADIFLKRALTFMALVMLAFALYIFIAAPLLSLRDGHIAASPLAVVALLGMWVTTALLYPPLRRAAVWFVDTIILRRADYEQLRTEIQRLVESCETSEAVLNAVGQQLAPALTASEFGWFPYDATASADLREQNHNLSAMLRPASGNSSAVIAIPTAETPQYVFSVGQLSGGRRLLSDDIAMLEAVAIIAARRIDALRISHERYERSLREQQISKLATEAELRALRSQINPHFLFNALTTIGYLIQTAPDRALDTLLQLTGLLRSLLRSGGEFVTLGDELSLIEAYLNIERERFEERLRVVIDVPPALRTIRIPSLLIQPLVENAVKHGIAPHKAGGEVMIKAHMEKTPAHKLLCITVRDTGAGVSEVELAHKRKRGVGLSNVENRLKNYYGTTAALTMQSARNLGAVVEIRLPMKAAGEVALSANETER